MKDNYPQTAGLYAFAIGSVLLFIGLGLSFLYKAERGKGKGKS